MADSAQGYENHLPRTVITGRGRCAEVAQVAAARGWRRVFVASDAGVAAAGLLDLVTAPLAREGLLAGVSTAIPAEPPLEDVAALAAAVSAARSDAVVGLGGGSVMDAAKVAALCAGRGGAPADYVGLRRAGGRGLPTILVPTTSGTGSEATFVAILTDAAAGTKVGVVDPAILAEVAIVDPALTDSLPAHVTAAAGMDACVHAIEAFVATVATPLSRGLALEAARHLGPALERACRDGADRAARDAMAVGAHLAGMAFANSSCCAVHALALPLGGRFHIPHGVITGCFAGALVRHAAAACADDFARLADAFGFSTPRSNAAGFSTPRPDAAGSSTPDGALRFAARLDALAAAIGLRRTLDAVAVPDAAVAAMARDAAANRRLMDPNPVPVTEADAARIYRDVLVIPS
ncbi:MAG: iron-containing alcohol dehydrogenase [Planctomycetaceae bacterium]